MSDRVFFILAVVVLAVVFRLLLEWEYQTYFKDDQ